VIGSPQQLAQPCTEWAATAANGRLTFTTVGPRRGSITISSEATGELCTSTGTKCRVCRHGTRCAHRPRDRIRPLGASCRYHPASQQIGVQTRVERHRGKTKFHCRLTPAS
jgi:hypothetical protein